MNINISLENEKCCSMCKHFKNSKRYCYKLKKEVNMLNNCLFFDKKNKKIENK